MPSVPSPRRYAAWLVSIWLFKKLKIKRSLSLPWSNLDASVRGTCALALLGEEKVWRRWQPFVPGMWNRRPAAASCSKISLKTTRNFRYKVKEITLVIGWYMLNRIKNSDLKTTIWPNLNYHFVTAARWKKQSVRQAGSHCIRNKWPMNGPYYSNMKPLWFYCPLYHPFFKKLMCTQSQRKRYKLYFRKIRSVTDPWCCPPGSDRKCPTGCL